ncbi:hypothetical protein JTB14_000015 [Gonioctena quinquepunctata]|nr:hypothetical protein JTB14_000015 [Gonioctena quinquepunctata]
MEKRRKLSYKFSKIPLNTVDKPVPMDISTEVTKMFQMNRKEKQRISENMCESIRKTKLKATVIMAGAKYPPLPSRPTTSKDLWAFAERCPIVEMSRFQEKDIRNKIHASNLEKKYPQLFSDMLKETKQEFAQIVHYAGMNLKIKACHPEAIFTIEPYKFVGKTDRYQEFLQTRKQFQNKWILHYPIVRNIHRECELNLPYDLFNLEFKRVKTLPELEYTLNDKTQRASQFIYEFYLRIIAIVEKEEMKKDKRVHRRDSLGASTGLLSLHFSRIIAHTLLNIVKVTAAEDTKPYLSLEVLFKNGLVLEPQAEAVTETYNRFLDRIIETGTEMYVLQRNRVKGFENKYMRLCLTNQFIDECKENIKKNIDKHYEPILNHLEKLNNEFCKIYKDINSESFFETISDIEFEEGCTKINHYRGYLHKVMFIPDFEFFKLGKMSIVNYRESLHDGLNENINCIFEKLCAQHLWEVNDLCETFKMINIRATLKPLTTEELVETGKYMTRIRNEHLEELNDRVHNSLHSLCQIIDLGILTEEHMYLNRDPSSGWTTSYRLLKNILRHLKHSSSTQKKNCRELLRTLMI